MVDVLADLVDQLSVERVERFIFRGRSRDLGWGRIFGGQVLGQSLAAANQTVADDRSVHSLHGYFLRPGDASKPVVYSVDAIRDGRSFATRRVVAVQNGVAIFNMSASFQVAETGLAHQFDEMPDVPNPDELQSQWAWIENLSEEVLASIPPGIRQYATAVQPIEMRPIDPIELDTAVPRAPRRRVWFRANGQLPDIPQLHASLLAYASDFHLLGSTMQPHGVTWMTPGMQVASLDHSMWLHRPFRLDDWLLYDIEGSTAQGARALARGRWFSQQGELVASTMQEGLIRDRRRPD
jgi:acyl-CoA thioesterase II